MTPSRRTKTPRIEAITFDFWDTLMISRQDLVRGRRIEQLAELIGTNGHGVRGIGDAVDAAISAYVRAWVANQPFGAAEAAAVVLDKLGCDGGALRSHVVEILAEGEPHPQMTPNAAEILKTLKDAGLRIGIICDVAMTPSPMLRRHLADHQVLELFDHWSFSDESGHFKPYSGAFAHAHAGLGIHEPASAAHIGDLRRTDVAGGLTAGCFTLRYAGINDDPPAHGPEADVVITDHRDLPAALGLN